MELQGFTTICLVLSMFRLSSGTGSVDFSWGTPFDNTSCSSLNRGVVDEIASYKPIADRIYALVKDGAFQYKFYNDLASLVDMYGSRLSGSPMFEKSVTYMYKEMKKIGLDNLHMENVVVPNWQRGEEVAYMLAPIIGRNISVVAFGESIPTPPEGITAEVIIIPSFAFIRENASMVAGKIAVFDLYGKARRRFKLIGGPEALKAGAVLALSRSVVSMSIYSVSARSYSPIEPAPIPIASITDEDVDLFIRLIARGEKVILFVKLSNTVNNVASKNVMADYLGREEARPNEILVVSGHMDSWDISQGAQDNGCGAMLAMEIPQVLQNLSLVPGRTIRSLLTVGSEYAFIGTRQYANTHNPLLLDHIGALIADAGCAKPQGYVITEKYPQIGCVLQEIIKLFNSSIYSPWGLSLLISNETFTTADVFTEQNVPNILLNGDDGRFFWVRHTYADTLSHIDYDALDDILVFWTTTAYVLADMQYRLIDVPFQ